MNAQETGRHKALANPVSRGAGSPVRRESSWRCCAAPGRHHLPGATLAARQPQHLRHRVRVAQQRASGRDRARSASAEGREATARFLVVQQRVEQTLDAWVIPAPHAHVSQELQQVGREPGLLWPDSVVSTSQSGSREISSLVAGSTRTASLAATTAGCSCERSRRWVSVSQRPTPSSHVNSHGRGSAPRRLTQASSARLCMDSSPPVIGFPSGSCPTRLWCRVAAFPGRRRTCFGGSHQAPGCAAHDRSPIVHAGLSQRLELEGEGR